jgi:hypothetical protein
MDTHPPGHEDDLSAVERRLLDWRPNSANLDGDAMLFAAGLAAGRRRGRLVWPALCFLFAAQAGGLALWAYAERADRLALAKRLEEHAPTSIVAPAPMIVESVPVAPSDGYLVRRRLIEDDPAVWLAYREPASARVPAPPSAILNAFQREALLDQ